MWYLAHAVGQIQIHMFILMIKRKRKREREREGGREPKRLVKVCRHVRRECLECVGSTLLPRDLTEGADVIEHEALVIDAVWIFGN